MAETRDPDPQVRDASQRPVVRRRALAMTRIGLPVLIVLAGLLVVVVGDGETAAGVGMALIAVAGVVVVANAFMRLGLSSERDRDAEQQARRRFDRTGRWEP